MIASMMMYERPQLADAHRRYWHLIRHKLSQRGIESPQALSQQAEEFSVWTHPQLVLSQTCGMPYRTRLHGKVTLIGTADFALPECPPGYYRSPLVVRADDNRQQLGDYRDGIFAYNQTYSQSGYAAAYWHLQTLGFWFDNTLHTEQHIESARAVAEKRADLASLDAVTWMMMQRYEPFTAGLRVLEWTEPTPGLPYISAIGADRELVFSAIEAAIEALTEDDRKLLGISGIVYIEPEAYLAIPNPPVE